MRSPFGRRMSAVQGLFRVTGICRFALVRVELLLNHSLRPRLLADGLMLRLELYLAGLTDSDDRNVLDPLDDPKIALGHEYSLPQFACAKRDCLVRVGRAPLSAALEIDPGVRYPFSVAVSGGRD